MDAEDGVPVDLYIYDLTNGFASLLSPAILGRQVEGVWHTAVVAYGREYFYGGGGVVSCAPGSTALGAPRNVQRLGVTHVPFPVFVDYLHALSTTTFTGAAYQLLEHNCNHFSDEVAQFLCGARCPKHILTQPEDALPPHLRDALSSLLGGLVPENADTGTGGVHRSSRESPDYLTLNNQIEEARLQSQQLEQRRNTLAEKLARKERRREKRRRKQQRNSDAAFPDDDDDADVDADNNEMAESAEAAAAAAEDREPLESAGPAGSAQRDYDERRAEELRQRERNPPIVYKNLDAAQEYEGLRKALAGVPLSPEEEASADELRQYLVGGEGSWVLGDDFLAFIGRLLEDGGVGGEARASALRCLACCALRDDVALVLHQDRRHHAITNYASRIDQHPEDEQYALTMFMCNLFEHVGASEWLLYISEWEHRGQPLSNIRATTKVAVHAALSEAAALREVGTALLYNIAGKEVKTVVFDEVCAELAMAALQLVSLAPPEEVLYRACAALARLAHHAPDVPHLIKLVGPDPSAFRGTSARVDEQIDLIMATVK